MRYSITVAWRGSALFVLVWLAAAARRLHAAREAFAEDAVTRERIRIEDQLDTRLGGALSSVVAVAQRSLDAARTADETLEETLRRLVAGSRKTLADARKLISSMQQVSLRNELETAASVLTAAGIPTSVEIDSDDFAGLSDDDVRRELRTQTARLLAQPHRESACVLSVTTEADRVHLGVRVIRGPAPSRVRTKS
jgi:signal transduction histidine kinase